jgi:hypothetical protein
VILVVRFSVGISIDPVHLEVLYTQPELLDLVWLDLGYKTCSAKRGRHNGDEDVVDDDATVLRKMEDARCVEEMWAAGSPCGLDPTTQHVLHHGVMSLEQRLEA